MDKLLCKKDFINGDVEFKKDEMYFYWSNFGGLNHFISHEAYSPGFLLHKVHGGVIFPFDGEISRHSDRPYLYDYFYTKEEMRDINIKKIIENLC